MKKAAQTCFFRKNIAIEAGCCYNCNVKNMVRKGRISVGKGRRNREQRQDLHPFERLYKKADKQQKTAGGFAVTAVILTVLGSVLPVWSISIMTNNIVASQYAAEELAILTPLLPIGRLALTLIAVGALLCAILLWCRRAGFSSIGLALCAIGEGALIYFAIVLGQVFAYDPLEQRGLAFADLVVRYYVLLVPFMFLAAAIVCGLVARKNRTVAAAMQNAIDIAPTVMLDEEEEP